MPIQQMMLGAGGAAKKTYLDDVFSTYVYGGNSTARSINNGLNLSSEGGMVWIKSRDNSYDHYIVDTERGVLNRIRSNSDGGSGSAAGTLTAFNNNGFSLGTDSVNLVVNASNKTYSSWTFRKAPGFFDVVTWTGNSSTTQTISHNLGSIPGCIMVKRTNGSQDWGVYHRGLDGGNQPETHYLTLNEAYAENDDNTFWSDTAPTASTFEAGAMFNENAWTYVAYVFAGGESPAATARSVYYDESSNLTVAPHADIDFGSGDWTIEGWWKSNKKSSSGDAEGLFALGNYAATGGMLLYQYDGDLKLNKANTDVIDIAGNNPFDNKFKQWLHVALVKSGTTVTIYVDGDPLSSYTDSGTFGDSNNHTMYIGTSHSSHTWNGSISNFRVVKGTAVYTSAFKPSTEPLTNITNTKLLCCNNSSVTGSTVTPGTITANGSTLVASTDSPFDDPAGFSFGEAGNQNVIATGSYVGNGDPDGHEVFLGNGWEPQWLMIKRSTGTEGWAIFDSMRGIVSGGNDNVIESNSNSTEYDSGNYVDLISTGFRVRSSSNLTNNNGDTYVYIAIRRPDGYVGKPAEAGTDVFTMDTGNSNTVIPNFDSGFPVDFAWAKIYGGSGNWWTSARLIQKREVQVDTTIAEQAGTNKVFDSNVGWHDTNGNSTYISHMWKRHAGFDVVTYIGNSTSGHQIPHSMNQIPEMMWVKNRSLGSEKWYVYHKDLALAAGDGGTDSEKDYFMLNESDSYYTGSGAWNNTAPTSTHFTVGNGDQTNDDGKYMIAMLFSSVSGISKVGSYTGTGSAWSGSEVTCGFQPRFIIIKRSDAARNWCVYDTLRGIDNQGGGTEEKVLFLNETDAQDTAENITLSSTGFTFPGGSLNANASSGKYIFYAHA